MNSKTSKERTRKYRKKLRESLDLYEEVKRKDRERKQKEYLSKKTTTSVEVRRFKEREKKRKQREAKRNFEQLNSAQKKVPDEQYNAKSGISPQNIGRMVNKTRKSLPKCPQKQVHVLTKLVNKLSPRKRKLVVDSCDQAAKRRKGYDEQRKKRSDALTDEEVKTVKDFYVRDDVSRVLPGRKDYVSVKMADGTREHRQKRWLLSSIGEAYALFKSESTMKIGLSKFAELRPAEVLPMSLHDQEVCICKYHENIDLLLLGISRVNSSAQPSILSSEKVVLLITVCDIESVQCIDRECNNCGVNKASQQVFDGLEEECLVTYHQWKIIDKGKVKKEFIECTIAEAREDLEAQLSSFSRHIYNIKRQHKEFTFLKENLKEDEIIIHEDFSENFALKHQREIMEAHWSNDSVTIFTAVVYYKENGCKELKHQSYVIISDELRHDKASVCMCNQALLEALSQVLSFKKVHYFSDGAGSQFKNKFHLSSIIYHQDDYDCDAMWNFFETEHGKGAVDGVGGQSNGQSGWLFSRAVLL